MNENQRKWLQELQKKGVKFEYFSNQRNGWFDKNTWGGELAFNSVEKFRIPAQPIPNIPDWREVCADMQSKGVMFEYLCFDGHWTKGKFNFPDFVPLTHYHIPAQPIPEWGEEMIEPKEELDKIPHRLLQIQWHEDCLHHLKTGEPMREWEFKEGDSQEWSSLADYGCYPEWHKNNEYRRKPRMKKVTLWYCLGQNINDPTDFKAFCSIHSCLDLRYRVEAEECAPFGAVVENQVEIPEN